MWWSKSSGKPSRGKAATPGTQQQPAPRRRALMMALEPRFMFDGAVAATHAEAAHHQPTEHIGLLDHLRPAEAARTPAAAPGPAVVFVDSRVADAASLLQGVAAGSEVVYLKADQDGLQQIATYLAAHHEVGSVEIVAHGNDAELLLGSTDLTSANIDAQARTLSAIGANLKQGADILVYACDTAADARGVAFVDTLARLTGHDVAASSNVTGAGGDWTLEVRTGDISAVPVLSRQAESSYGYALLTNTAGDLATLQADINTFSGDSTNDTITLTSDITFTAGSHATITINHTGSGTLTIDGGGHTIDAAWLNQVVKVTSGTVVLENVTIEHGLVAGTGGNGSAAGASAMGAGISNAGNLTLNNANVTLNYATGGGGGGAGSAGGNVGFAGGGGSGAHGIGGGTSGVSFPSTYGAVPGGSGNGGTGGSFSGNYGGKGGTSSGGGAGGQSDGGFYAAGGNGATATGTVKIGGGGGGSSGEAFGSGGNGGNAVGGIYNSGKLYVIGTSAITHNYGAGGGGGGACGSGNIAGSGGTGIGGIWNTVAGTVKMTSSTYSAMSSNNHGGNGHGGYSYNGASNGTTPATTYNTINTSGSITTNYVAAPTVTSVAVPGNGNYHTGQSLSFTVDFSTAVNVTGTPELALTLDTGGTVQATYQGGTGTSALVFAYTVQAGQQDATGITVGALTLNGGTIKDSSNNAAVLTLNNVASTASVDVQAILPTVSSINVTGSSPTNGTSESFTVTYSEAMNPSTVLAADFTATQVSGSITDTGITVAEVSTSVYTVTVNGVSGNGVLRLDMNSGTSEQDSYGNTISGGHTGNQTYTVDQTAPTISSIVPAAANPGKGGSETFTVTFSEAVSGVDSSDFTVAASGTTDTGITGVTTSDNIHYTVTVGGVGGNGTLGLNLNASGTGIADAAGNAITGGLTGSPYTIDTTPPTASSITAVGSLTNNASSEAFTVTFSEPVAGVTASDFTLTTANTPGGTALTTGGITSITTSDNIHYTVTVGSVAGDGTLRLDLKAASTGITDAAGNGATAGFASGDTYTIEHTPPAVTSSVATGTATNNAGSDAFTVTFSESVSGVNSGDFDVNLTGTAAYTGIQVTPLSGSTYQVTVQGVTGDGTLQLAYDGSAHDVTDAAGNIAAANYTAGDTYTVDHTAPTVTSVAVPANATYIAGQHLDFTVNFSEAVTVSGTPEIGITLDTGGTVYAQYLSGSGTTALTFRYTVLANEGDPDGIGVGSSLVLNGGTIQDAATNAAVATLNSVGSTSGVLVDAIAPTVVSVGVPSNGTYGAGQALTFTVDFSENVLVTTGGGTPSIAVTLDTGGTVQAAYVGGSGTNALTFAYTITSGESDLTGVAVGSAISLHGGTIKDAATNAAVLTLNSVGSTAAVLVDATPPTVTAIDIVDPATNNGSSEHFVVTFDVPVSGVDASDFSLSGTNTVNANALLNSQVVAVSPDGAGRSTTWDVTLSGVTGDGQLRLDMAYAYPAVADQPIVDQFGNQLASGTNHPGDQAYTIDHTAPSVVSVTPPASGTYVAGQDITFDVVYSEAVTVDASGGTPRIPITLTTGGTVYADYVSGSGSSTLVFTLAVAPGEQALSGIGVAGSVDTNGGTIRDAASNDAVETLTGLSSPLAGVDIDAIVPSVTAVGVPAAGTYGVASDLDFTLDFNKAVTVDTTGGTPYIQVTLDTGGTVDAAYLSGSGSSQLTFRYVVPTGESDPNGITVGTTLFTGGGTIRDSVGHDAATSLAGVGNTSGVLVDSIAPTASSIHITGASLNNAATDTFTVTFDKPVNGVDASDFTVVGSGTAAGAVTSVSGSGTTWTVTVGNAVGDGTLRLDLSASGDPIVDNHGNTLVAAHTGDQSYTVRHTPPAASSMTVPADGTYAIGQAMDFTVTYTEAVTVDATGGTPRIAISLDTGGTVYATYLSGSGTNTLTFRYVPASGQQDLTGIVTATAVDANGGTLRDAAGNNAALAVNAVEPSTANVDVDAIIPVVASVSVPTSATYGVGQHLDFTVDFNKAVTVDTSGGTPFITLTLATGGTVDAAYVSGSGTSSLVFEYVVAPNEAAPAGVVLGTSISLNGGALHDAHGNAGSTTLNGVANASGVLVDSIAPTVTSITTDGSVAGNASSATYTVTFSEGVTGVDAGDFVLTATGSAHGTVSTVTAVSAGVYTVTVDGIAGDGTLRLDVKASGTGIADLAGNAVQSGFTGGSAYTFDHTPPAVQGVGVPPAGLYTVGQDLDFTVTYSEAVTVSGTPRIAVTLANGATAYADYLGGSGTTALSFRYVVAQGDFDSDGITLAGGSIDLHGGSMTDAAGNAAVLALASVGDTSHVLVDGTDPAVAGIASSATGTVNGDSVTYTVTFDEAVTGLGTGAFHLTTTGNATGTIASVVPSGSDGTTYTVTIDGIAGTGSLRLDLAASSGVSDLAGLPVAGYTAGQVVNVDHVDSTVVGVDVPVAGTYKPGETLTFDVDFSRPVTVDTSGGVPSLALTLANGAVVQATYVSGSGSDVLVFSYTLGQRDSAPHGIAVAGSIAGNGGTLTGIDGNPAALALAQVGSTGDIDIQGNTGRGLSPGLLPELAPPGVSGPAWTAADGGSPDIDHLVPTTAQTTWAAVPLISSTPLPGEVLRDSATDIGSDVVFTALPSAGRQFYDPSPLTLPPLEGSSADDGDLLHWQPPGRVEQPPAETGQAAGHDPQPAGHATDKPPAHVQPHVADAHRIPAAAPSLKEHGKASLAQQFARHGHQAWERDKAALVANVRQSAQRRTG